MKILHLTLHRRYFDAIASGEKREEHRRCCPHWKPRIEDREYNVIEFRNGYNRGAPMMRVEYLGWRVRDGIYILRLGRILTIRR